jgi:hypothetical protein
MRGVRNVAATGAAALAVAAALAAGDAQATPAASGEPVSQLALQEATQMESHHYIDDALGTGVR